MSRCGWRDVPPSRSERAAAPIELALGVAVILLPAALLVLSFGPWLESRSFVRSAAAVAARQVAVSGSERGLTQSLAAMAENAGMDSSSVVITLCGGTPSRLGYDLESTCLPLARDGRVVARISARVPVVTGPWGEVGGLTVSAEHTEFTDLYRALP